MEFHSEQKLDKEYMHRINVALQYIDDHLDEDLSLAVISETVLYSPFHFHRIFRAVVGEPLNTYVIRKRIEKMASILMHRQEVRITELSQQYGFNSNSSFTRAFKKFYGVSPSEFRKQNPGKFSKIGTIESKIGQEKLIFEKYICNSNHYLNWIQMNAKIEVKETPELTFATVTQIGVDGMELAFEKMLKWARPREVFKNPTAKMARIFHDSFKITDPDKVRMSVCIFLDEEMKAEGEIGRKSYCWTFRNNTQ